MYILQVRGADGTFHSVPAIKGDKGDAPLITSSKANGITTLYANGVEFARIADGAPGSDATATDVQVNGVSITSGGVANIPKAGNHIDGVVSFDGIYGNRGITVNINGDVQTQAAELTNIDNRTIPTVPVQYRPIVPYNLDYAVKSALTDGKGAAYTNAEKLAAKERIGLGGDFELIEEITLAEDATIDRTTDPNGKRYNFKHALVEVELPVGVSFDSPCSVVISTTQYSAAGYVYLEATTSAKDTTVKRFSRNMLFNVNGFNIGQFVQFTRRNFSVSVQQQTSDNGRGFQKAYPINRVFSQGAQFKAGTIIRIYGVWA